MAEACCYFLRLLQHALERQGIFIDQGEYKESDAPEDEYICKTANFARDKPQPLHEKLESIKQTSY